MARNYATEPAENSLNSKFNLPATPPTASVKTPVKPHRWFVRSAWLTGILAVLIVFGYIYRARLLTHLASAWVVNLPTTTADAIVVLGGNVDDRPFAAAKLFQQHVAPKILYMDVSDDPVNELNITQTEREITRRILLSNSVPESAIQAIGQQVDNTYDESRAVRAWVRQTGATSILITTDLFHTRRARWIFRHELRDTPVRIYVIPVNLRQYTVDNWWKTEGGVIAFQNEVIKFIYYRLKY